MNRRQLETFEQAFQVINFILSALAIGKPAAQFNQQFARPLRVGNFRNVDAVSISLTNLPAEGVAYDRHPVFTLPLLLLEIADQESHCQQAWVTQLLIWY